MDAFKVEPPVEVLLVSLRAGGVGFVSPPFHSLLFCELTRAVMDVQTQPHRRSSRLPHGAFLEPRCRGSSSRILSPLSFL
jgi:hypothetical protein